MILFWTTALCIAPLNQKENLPVIWMEFYNAGVPTHYTFYSDNLDEIKSKVLSVWPAILEPHLYIDNVINKMRFVKSGTSRYYALEVQQVGANEIYFYNTRYVASHGLNIRYKKGVNKQTNQPAYEVMVDYGVAKGRVAVTDVFLFITGRLMDVQEVAYVNYQLSASVNEAFRTLMPGPSGTPDWYVNSAETEDEENNEIPQRSPVSNAIPEYDAYLYALGTTKKFFDPIPAEDKKWVTDRGAELYRKPYISQGTIRDDLRKYLCLYEAIMEYHKNKQ